MPTLLNAWPSSPYLKVKSVRVFLYQCVSWALCGSGRLFGCGPAILYFHSLIRWFCCLGTPKTGKRVVRLQACRTNDLSTCVALRRVVANLPQEEPLFPFQYGHVQSFISSLASFFGLSSPRLTTHACRRGRGLFLFCGLRLLRPYTTTGSLGAAQNGPFVYRWSFGGQSP